MGKLYKLIIAIFGSVITYLFGGWSALLELLVVFVTIDYITGMAAGATEGKLSSSVGIKGISKKICKFAVVGISYMIDKTLGCDTLFRDAAIYFYLANELLSIAENLGRMKVPLPPVIEKAILIFSQKGDVDDEFDKQ